MAFKLVKCKGPKGLPLIEIPDGPRIAERLSPGTIREADFYENFRVVKRGGAEVLVACPRGKLKKGRCEVPLRALRIWHPKSQEDRIVRECRKGKLSEKRMNEVERILKDVGMGDIGSPEDKTVLHEAALFILGGMISTILAVITIRLFFPEGVVARKDT